MEIVVTIMKVIVLLFLLYQSYLLGKAVCERHGNIAVLAKSTVDTAIGKSKSTYFSEDNLKAIMSKHGLMYMLHDYNLEASTFILFKIGFSIMLGIASAVLFKGSMLAIIMLLFGIVIGFYLPDIILKESNRSDNVAMLDDIITVYTMLKIHAKSNVHITDSLIECQRTISNGRLKEGFKELNNNILSKKITIEESVDLFNSRFDNDNINNLCIILRQSLRTGHSSEILSDITKQIEDVNRVRSQEKKHQLERKMAFIQVLFFTCIASIAIFVTGMEMFSAISTL